MGMPEEERKYWRSMRESKDLPRLGCCAWLKSAIWKILMAATCICRSPMILFRRLCGKRSDCDSAVEETGLEGKEVKTLEAQVAEQHKMDSNDAIDASNLNVDGPTLLGKGPGAVDAIKP